MISFIISRLLNLIPLVLITTMIVFTITVLLPGDPTVTILGEDATAAQREIAREQYGLNDPLPVQYVNWLGRALTGDLGRSLHSNERVIQMLMDRIPVSIELTILSILVAVAIGVPAGVIAARSPNTIVDLGVSFLAMTSVAIPYFWSGILLILLFSVRLGLVPPSGFIPITEDPVQHFRLMLLPSLTIGTSFAALIMRQTRASVLQVMSQDYIRSSRAKGLSERVVVFKHALRNALIPVVTVVGLQIGGLLSGTVVTETIFSLPGIGRLLVDAIFARDFPVIQGTLLFIVSIVLIVNLITDIAYMILDPRIRYKTGN
jgi:ABC-type dipeptide/oligopeptide/nickel transport systems, permease components